MARLTFTKNLARHIECPPLQVNAETVRAAVDAAFARDPRLRGYVLDDQGALRKHMVVFVDGRQIRDRAGLSDPVAANSEIHVMQALSGG